MFRVILWIQFIDWCNLFSQHYLRALSAKNANHLQTTDTIKRHQRYSIHYHRGWPSLGIWGSATHYGLPALPEPFLRACGLHNMMFRVILCIQFYRLTQLIFSTLLKGIIRKECQSFTNHGHDKTPPTVFSPLSLWLTLPRNMGVSHTVWPPSITRAILACLWFAQYDVQVILCIQFYRSMQLIFWRLLNAYFSNPQNLGRWFGRKLRNAFIVLCLISGCRH